MGAAYSEGVILVHNGADARTGLPWNVWDVIALMRGVQAKHGGKGGGDGCEDAGGEGRGRGGDGSSNGGGGGGALRFNCSSFLIEELVEDVLGAAQPVDYRIYVSGDTVLWIELTCFDAALGAPRQAAVDETLLPPRP